jgi:hypothetical protein
MRRVLAKAPSSNTGEMAARTSTIAQCLNLEHEIHNPASKLRILGFEPLN